MLCSVCLPSTPEQNMTCIFTVHSFCPGRAFQAVFSSLCFAPNNMFRRVGSYQWHIRLIMKMGLRAKWSQQMLPVIWLSIGHNRDLSLPLPLVLPPSNPPRHFSSRALTPNIDSGNHLSPIERHGKTCQLVEGRMLRIWHWNQLQCWRGVAGWA